MTDVTKSSGNIFEDLNVPEADEFLAKAELARQIHKTILSRKLTQAQSAQILKISQPDVSELVCGKLKKFSLDRLIHLLNLLDCDVDIVIKKKKQKKLRGRTHVIAA
jgi:predicted XRE-type DNA-binding protein